VSMNTRRAGLMTIGLALSASPIRAQIVHGTVTLPDSSPAVGAIVVASGIGGADSTRTLTNANGQYTLRLPATGQYSVSVMRIGFRSTTVSPVDVRVGETRIRTIVFRNDPIVLSSVNVNEQSDCRVNPAAGLAVAQAWAEVRHAILATQVQPSGAPFTVEQIEYNQTLDASGRYVRKQTVTRTQSGTQHPYISLPADTLASKGYVLDESDGTVFFAPDADVLLSESFASTHCFRLVAPPADRPGLVGVGFQPAKSRYDAHDISGVFWIDRTTTELRSLEFTYTNLPYIVRAVGARGRVEFMHRPDGEWLVSQWDFRMPVSALERPSITPGGEKPAVRAVEVMGGLVEEVTHGDTVLYRATGDTLAVQLLSDRAELPPTGATLTLSDADYSIKADSLGMIAQTPVFGGVYTARVSTPLMDSLGIDAVEQTIEVRDPMHVDSIALPTARDVVLKVCPAKALLLGAGMLRGSVRSEHGDPQKHATVSVSWLDEITKSANGLVPKKRQLDTRSDSTGRWLLCGVPTNWKLAVRIASEPDSNAQAFSVTAERPFASVDLVAKPKQVAPVSVARPASDRTPVIARWMAISFGEPTIALDTTSVAKNMDGFPSATLLMTYAAPRGGDLKQVARILEVFDFDCSQRQVRPGDITTFAPSGELLNFSHSGASTPWMKPTRRSREDDALSAFCRTDFAHR
jgi:hypothetical protein